MQIKSGYVAVIGNPNAGKSSLVNAIVKEKVSIVSPKPQTTRNNILGIYNDKDSQIIFVDTPGINKANSGLDNFMQKSIKGAVSDVDVVCLVIDITKGVSKTHLQMIDNYFAKYPALKDRVVFTGHIVDKKELFGHYSKAKIFTLSSLLSKFLFLKKTSSNLEKKLSTPAVILFTKKL